MSPTVLPRIIDVFRYFRSVDLELKSKGEHVAANRGTKAWIVATEVMKLWEKSSIPTVSFARAEKMVVAWWNRLILMKKLEGKRQKSEKCQEQFDSFKNVALLKLFDIASC